jgi:hypothetical protein
MPGDPMLDRLRKALTPMPFTEQKMFGGVCLLADGKMLVCPARPHARPMEMGGREMQGYVFVAPEGAATEAALRKWLDLALAYVKTLPSKAAKVRKPAGKAKDRKPSAKAAR